MDLLCLVAEQTGQTEGVAAAWKHLGKLGAKIVALVAGGAGQLLVQTDLTILRVLILVRILKRVYS